MVSYVVPENVVIHGYNGFRVNNLDPLDYANVLESMLRDGSLWLNLSRRVLEYVKRFTHVEIARKYGELLKLAVRKPTKLNVIRALAYPVVKIVPSMRMLIAVVAEKDSKAESKAVTRR